MQNWQPYARSWLACGALMRNPGDILLIACYELGHQPLALASPLAMLHQAGFAPAALDISVQALDEEAVRQARLVAISVPMHTALRLGTQVAARVRALNPTATIAFYGLYATLNADYLLSEAAADALIGGEFEMALVKLAEVLAADSDLQQPIPGVWTRLHPAPPALVRVPFVTPARESLPPLSRYAHFERNGEAVVAGYVEATRGCKHVCRHCPITPVYEGRFFAVPREVVLADIRAQAAAGARHITFGDPDFLNGPTHALRLARALHAEFPDLTWDATIKIEHILKHRELFPEFAALGCAFVLSAVESLNPEVLRRLDKGHTPADVDETFTIMADAGIALRPSLLPFTPWSTLDDYAELLDFFASRGLLGQVDPVQFSIRLLVPPGSALLADPAVSHWLGALDPAAFTYRWQHPDPRMDDLQHEVSALVETAAHQGLAAADTIATIRARVAELRGEPAAPLWPRLLPAHSAPRLTEAWFC
jgi:radical SAM superfamily enzyme YgiQ (UPF0313 family)